MRGVRHLFAQKHDGCSRHLPESIPRILGSVVPAAGMLGGVERLRNMLDLNWRHPNLPTVLDRTEEERGIRSHIFGITSLENSKIIDCIRSATAFE